MYVGPRASPVIIIEFLLGVTMPFYNSKLSTLTCFLFFHPRFRIGRPLSTAIDVSIGLVIFDESNCKRDFDAVAGVSGSMPTMTLKFVVPILGYCP